MSTTNKPVIFVVGSTASGKSDWALKMCQEFGGQILNCDSVQVYQKLDIGSAKPSLEERSLVPHHLFDYVAPPKEMTAGVYCDDFYACMESLPSDKPTFVVGGTGFYFMAIEKGMYPVIRVSEELKKQVEDEIAEPGGQERLHAELQAADPEYGAKIHLSDKYRIGRAIELIRTQGRSVTAIQKEFEDQKKPFPFPLLKIGPQWEREVLRQRITLRTEKMLNGGLVEEVRGLLDEGLATWAPMSSVGYKETIAYLQGQLNHEQLFEEIAKNTHQLAKRQRTWFQRDAQIHWAPGASGYLEVRSLVENFLNSLP